ncbi:hypothetical protein AAVH_14952 [Aphelenchoides avenae]|nr:hypothetical protein AAVH_14952 [Aphelenchus avenae]
MSRTAFLRDFVANAQDVDFVVERVELEASSHKEPVDDYALLDSIMSLLRPLVQHLEFSPDTSTFWINLLKRPSLMHNSMTCQMNVYVCDYLPCSSSVDVLVPPAFVLNETYYPNYDLRCFDSDAVPWIDTFLNSFVQGECTNEKLQSVGITWDGEYDGTYRQLPRLLIELSETDVAIPRDDFALYHNASEYHLLQCDVYSLTSTKSKKRMDIFKWSAEVPQYHDPVHAILCELKDI